MHENAVEFVLVHVSVYVCPMCDSARFFLLMCVWGCVNVFVFSHYLVLVVMRECECQCMFCSVNVLFSTCTLLP